MSNQNQDEKYIKILLNRIRKCKNYKPKFGTSKSVSLQDFKEMYGADPFYSWFGLDNPMLYAAHRAAGGITSVYRQIGLGGEELYRQIIQDEFGLSAAQANWSYETKTESGRKKTLSLDARIDLEDVNNKDRAEVLQEWIARAAKKLDVKDRVAATLDGVVIEIRQGYKSRDSKRQNADLSNASVAYTQGYLPINLILSSQIDETVAERYERGKMLVLRGYNSQDDLFSTYAFSDSIIGYDLVGFFERNAPILQKTIEDVLQTLLSTKQ